MISFDTFSESDFDEISAFHKKSFEKNSYQSNPEYLKWLYVSNPHRSSDTMGWIARDAERRIVGCIHVMYLPAEYQGKKLAVHSLQNLTVDQDLRSGAGMILVKRALRKSDIAIFPGVFNQLEQTYRALNYQAISGFWGKRILRPAAVGWGLVSSQFGLKRSLPKKIESKLGSLSDPTPAQLDDLAGRMCELSDNRICWTNALLKWRFFSNNGPRNLLFIDDQDPQSYCVVAIAMRKNICLARLVEFGQNVEFIKQVMAKLKGAGVELCLSYAAAEAGKASLRKCKFSKMKKQPTSFLKFKPKKDFECSFLITGGSTDVGQESLGAF